MSLNSRGKTIFLTRIPKNKRQGKEGVQAGQLDGLELENISGLSFPMQTVAGAPCINFRFLSVYVGKEHSG